MNNAPFYSLKLLKEDMEKKDWVIDIFDFKYNQENYYVLVKLYLKEESKPKFALSKLEFLRVGNIFDRLQTAATLYDLLINDVKEFREYFRIQYNENLGDIITQFKKYLSMFIPIEYKENKKTEDIEIILDAINRSDSNEKDKDFCFAVKRNTMKKKDGSIASRSEYNDNKTRLKRPKLYEFFSTDKSISFCYSANAEDEKNDEEIISNFNKNAGLIKN